MSNKKVLKYANCYLLALVLMGILIRLYIYYIGRSLWLDEAMLAKCVMVRDFEGLTHGMLEYSQSAPLGFLLISKIFYTIIPSTEIGLRAFPMMCGILSIPMTYFVARDVFKSRIPLFSTSMISVIGILILQSNMFKAYSTDVFCSLTSLWMYNRYQMGKISFLRISLIYSILAWFSFGNLFVMGGICIYHFLNEIIIDKQTQIKGKLTKSLIPLSLIGFSVLLYYVVWVKPSTENLDREANEYWRWLSFPIVPKSMDDISLIFMMVKDFISPLTHRMSYLFLGCSVLYFVIHRKSSHTIILLICGLLILIASSLGLFPIAIRLQLFYYVLFLIAGCNVIEYLLGNCVKNPITIVALSLFLIIPLHTLSKSIKSDPRFLSGEEFKSCHEYIENNAVIESKVYFPAITRPMADLYTDFSIPMDFTGPIIEDKNNHIWGSLYREMHNKGPYRYDYTYNNTELEKNVEAIVKYRDVYIIQCHKEAESMEILYEKLRTHGVLKEEFNHYGSIVYHFKRK